MIGRFFRRLAAFTAAALAASYMLPAVYAEDQRGFDRLVTSYNHDCYAEIKIDGDTFDISGVFADDRLTDVSISMVEPLNGNELSVQEDGSFTARIVCGERYKNASLNIIFMFESGLMMNYLLFGDENGWYFPDNGLAQANAEKLEDIQTASPEAAAFYLSENADPDEIRETMAELEQIVGEVCGDETDDYKKAYLLNRWIGENIYYDHDAAESEVTLDTVAVHNVLERRRTTCAGFANTYCALLETAGIRGVNLKGAAAAQGVTYDDLPTTGENHEFTAFWYKQESRWAYVDPCWTSNGDYRDGEYYSGIPSDKYFDITGEAFAFDHRADKAEERDYSAALDALDAGSETTPEAQTSEETSSETEFSPVTSSEEAASAENNSDVAVYILTGAVGLVLITAGIVFLARKKR